MRSTLFLFLTAISVISQSALAGDADKIFLRGKFGPTFYHNVDPVHTALGIGLDLGYQSASGWGFTAMGNLNFSVSESNYSGTVNSSTALKSRFFGIAPTYSFSKSIATITMGVGVGVLATEALNYVSAPTSSTSKVTNSRLALAPQVDIDFDIYAGITANIGVKYVAGFGDDPKAGYVAPTAGFGFHF